YGGMLDERRRHRDSEAQTSLARDLAGKLAAAHADHPKYRFLLAASELALADSLAEQFRNGPAEEYYTSARRRLTSLHQQDPADAGYRRELAQCEYNFGILYDDLQRRGEAANCYQASINLYEGLVQEQRLSPRPDIQLKLSSSLINLASIRKR